MSTLRRAKARLRIGRRRRIGGGSSSRRVRERARYGAHRGRVRAQRTGRRVAPLLTAVISLPLVVAAALIALVSRVAASIARRIDALSAIVTPERAVAAVAAAACVLLGVSQFVHFSAVQVDVPGYSDPSVSRLAAAPIAAPRDAGSAHAYVLLPVAALALVLIVLTLRGRWRLGRLVALCGFAGIAVTLLIDLPKGLDGGTAGLAYSGSKALLTQGFYAELAAATALALCGVLLGGFVHSAHPAAPAGGRRGSRRRRREPGRAAVTAPGAPLSGGTGA